MAISVNKIKSLMEARQVALLTGPAGTGKTAIVTQAADDLGWKMKYFSSSTLDPFSDLVGIPAPDEKTGQVNFYRPRDVNEAEVIFFDELNRAEPKTLNAVFEVIQFGSINGEKLPNLKVVIAAINPVSDEYDTEEMDLALLDRFDFYLDAEVKADYNYFKKVYGAKYARAGIKMFNDYQQDYSRKHSRSDQNTMGYFSPRRLDKLMNAFKLFPQESTIREVLPHDVVVSTKKVAEEFNVALENKKPKTAKPATRTAPTKRGSSLDNWLQLPKESVSTKYQANQALQIYDWAKSEGTRPQCRDIRLKVAESLAVGGVGPTTVGYFKKIIDDMTISERQTMYAGWDQAKCHRMRQRFPEVQYGWDIPTH